MIDNIEDLKPTPGAARVLKKLSETENLIQNVKPEVILVSLDDNEMMQYARKPEVRCSICKHPLAKMAEVTYLTCGKNVNRVVKWFEEQGYRVSWITVKTHMDEHCDFSAIKIDWIARVKERMSDNYIDEEEALNFGMAGLEEQMAELKSIDVSGDIKMMNDIAKTLGSLNNVYLGFAKAKNEMTGLKRETNRKVEEMSRAMGETLMGLHDDVSDQETKEKIRLAASDLQDKIKEIILK